MATRRTEPAEGGTATESSGFSEDQRSELEEIIARAVAGATPPPSAPAEPARTKPTDEQWDAMTDKARETWVRQECDWWLQDLVKMDADRKRDADIEALKNPPEPEPEKPPSLVTKLQRIMWGDPDKQAS